MQLLPIVNPTHKKARGGAQLITGSPLPSDAATESGAAETESAELGHNP